MDTYLCFFLYIIHIIHKGLAAYGFGIRDLSISAEPKPFWRGPKGKKKSDDLDTPEEDISRIWNHPCLDGINSDLGVSKSLEFRPGQ